jgi:hypothetical protein
VASYQKKEIKKEGANKSGYLALCKAVTPSPADLPLSRGCWQVKKGKVIQRKKK